MILDPIGGGRSILVDDRMMAWIAKRIDGVPDDYVWEYGKAIGLVSGGKIIAGMVVHSYLPHYKACELTFAATTPKWATKPSIRAMLRWPFQQLGCDRVTTVIASSNERAIRFNLGLGFKHEGTCRKGCGADDALIFGLLRSESPLWMGLRTPDE